MPRANTLSRSLDTVTVGELRAVLAGSDQNLTIVGALAKIEEANRVSAEHEADTRRYQVYVDRRQARHAQALESAASAVESGPTMASADTWQRRQEARRDGAETFEVREPLLNFADWVQHDRPEVYEGNAIRRAVRAVTRQEIAH